ncbi:MAG: prepilin-type N-terminal cleavage/methylation domain-containing protein [Pirellulales bacterium]
MKRSLLTRPSIFARRAGRRTHRGFTLLEVLIALTITLVLLGLVMEVFSHVGDGVQKARRRDGPARSVASCEAAPHQRSPRDDGPDDSAARPHDESRLLRIRRRTARGQLAVCFRQRRRRSGENLGGNWYTGRGGNNNHVVNSIVGDTDDILMFTTRSHDSKFTGRGGVKTGVTRGVKSRTAEVAWFLRRRTTGEARGLRNDNRPEYYTLHRRQFLVLPNGNYWGALTYANVDHSLRPEGGTLDNRATAAQHRDREKPGRSAHVAQ